MNLPPSALHQHRGVACVCHDVWLFTELNQPVFIVPRTSLASRSCPSCCRSTFSEPANSIDLHGSRSLSRSLLLSKSPSKSYRGNLLLKSISALLIHSVASRTQSSDDKSLDGNDVAEEAGQLRPHLNLYYAFLKTVNASHCCMLRRFWAMVSNTPARPERAALEHHFPPASRVGREKKWTWKQAWDSTSISHWSKGVDKAHSWSESILKVFLCPREIPRPQAPSGN